MPYWLKRRLKKNIFFNCHFLIAIFVGGKQFLLNLKPYSNRPFYTKACCKKSEGVLGRLFELFGLKCVNSVFSWNGCTVSLTTAVRPPPPQSWAGRWANFGGPERTYFSTDIVILFLAYSLDKTKFLKFLVHSSIVITFRVITNIVRKLLILTWFWLFELVENMLNDVLILFLVYIGKKGTKFDFGMFNGCLIKFLGTLQAILYQIKWTNFWGQIEPT